MAMGYVGLYWGIAQLVVPAAFGFLARAAGLPVALWVAGAVFLVAGLTNPAVFRWLVERQPHPQRQQAEKGPLA
jgi:nitrate/nitrite transporter NarK